MAGRMLAGPGRIPDSVACGRLAIDPYLSDSLADEVSGTPLPAHRAWCPRRSPLNASCHLTWCSARMGTGSHGSGGRYPGLLQLIPQCRFVVPRAERATALARGVPARALDRRSLRASTCSWHPTCRVRAVPAAHEQLETDAAGNHHFLGYALQLGDAVVYHSGDCVPFTGLGEELTSCAIDVALLPVNGRDAERREHGILGNFTFDEATALCIRCGIPSHDGVPFRDV